MVGTLDNGAITVAVILILQLVLTRSPLLMETTMDHMSSQEDRKDTLRMGSPLQWDYAFQTFVMQLILDTIQKT